MLTLQVFKWLMVTMNDELLEHKIVFPSLKGPNQSIKFFIGGIIESAPCSFSLKIYNWVSTLQ